MAEQGMRLDINNAKRSAVVVINEQVPGCRANTDKRMSLSPTLKSAFYR
jgi:hypothetical protein